MSVFGRLFRGKRDSDALRPLYAAIVAEARDPRWYRAGAVPDTLDGRFDMVAAVLAIVLLRLEAEGEAGRAPAALVTEQFVADMEGQLREMGVGDVVVGKHVGRMVAALGGRLDAYRAGLGGQASFHDALVRNLYRGEAPDPLALAVTAGALHDLANRLAATPLGQLLQGELPR